jgi:predicted metal-dependent hydrolase
VKVKTDVGAQTETVWLVDWRHPERNHFAIAEEVTVKPKDATASTKRPDVVLYVNGIALAVLDPGSDASQRERVLAEFYREALRDALLPPLLARWQPALGVTAQRVGIKRMKTRWGTCNPASGSVWINLELAKKPAACLEYVVVHELLHLRVRTHDDRFRELMDRHLPGWQHLRDVLNAEPLAPESWGA